MIRKDIQKNLFLDEVVKTFAAQFGWLQQRQGNKQTNGSVTGALKNLLADDPGNPWRKYSDFTTQILIAKLYNLL